VRFLFWLFFFTFFLEETSEEEFLLDSIAPFSLAGPVPSLPLLQFFFPTPIPKEFVFTSGFQRAKSFGPTLFLPGKSEQELENIVERFPYARFLPT